MELYIKIALGWFVFFSILIVGIVRTMRKSGGFDDMGTFEQVFMAAVVTVGFSAIWPLSVVWLLYRLVKGLRKAFN